MTLIVDTRNLESRGLANNAARRVDKSTYAPATMDYVKHECDDGTHFFLIATSGSIAQNVYATVFIRTSNTVRLAHLLIAVSCTNLSDFRLLENVTDNPNEPGPLYNIRRMSANTPETLIYPPANAAATNGTLLAKAVIGSSGGPAAFRVGGSASNRHEVILKPNMVYALQQRMLGATGGYINWELYFYEHADRL